MRFIYMATNTPGNKPAWEIWTRPGDQGVFDELVCRTYSIEWAEAIVEALEAGVKR